MIILRFILVTALTLPLFANEADNEIIKNLDFYLNIELIKDENILALKENTLDQRPKAELFDLEKKK